MSFVLPKWATAAAVVAIIAVSGVVIAAADRANSTAGPKNCRDSSKLTDSSSLTSHQAKFPDLSAGDTILYRDSIVGPSGKRVGTGSGTALIYTDAASGTLWESLAIYGSFGEGTFYGTTAFALANVGLGEPISVPVVGTSGHYLGKTGTYRLQLLQRPSYYHSIFSSDLTMCG